MGDPVLFVCTGACGVCLCARTPGSAPATAPAPPQASRQPALDALRTPRSPRQDTPRDPQQPCRTGLKDNGDPFFCANSPPGSPFQPLVDRVTYVFIYVECICMYLPAEGICFLHCFLLQIFHTPQGVFWRFCAVFLRSRGFTANRANLMNLSRTGSKLPLNPFQTKSSLLIFVQRIANTVRQRKKQPSQ